MKNTKSLEALLELIREQEKQGYIPTFILLYNPAADDNFLLYPQGTNDALAKAILEFCKTVTDADKHKPFRVPGTGPSVQ